MFSNLNTRIVIRNSEETPNECGRLILTKLVESATGQMTRRVLRIENSRRIQIQVKNTMKFTNDPLLKLAEHNTTLKVKKKHCMMLKSYQ